MPGSFYYIAHLSLVIFLQVAGAHTCYLVAETSFELFSKEARLCLVGADHFKYQRTFATPQAIQVIILRLRSIMTLLLPVRLIVLNFIFFD